MLMREPKVTGDNLSYDFNIVTNQISNLINTHIEQNFDRLTRIAMRMFDVPVIAISLFDEKRQLAKPVVSFDLSQLNVYMPFFNEFNTEELLVVEDATKNEQFKNHPLVTHDPKIRFFVSCPIFATLGKKVGSLILLDYKPRSFGLTDLNNLNDIIKLIETVIRDFRLSKSQKLLLQEISAEDRNNFTDQQTRAWNFDGFKKILRYQIMESEKDKTGFALAMVDIDNLHAINEKYGKEVGDEHLTLTSSTILKSCRDADTLARGDDEDFIVIINADNPEHVKIVVDRIKDNIAKAEIKLPDGSSLGFNVTIGVSYFAGKKTTPETLLSNTRIALLKGKRQGRNKIVFHEPL
ncbi:sensor domain-containing diguanylate cyclase [Legionella shakespearei]|uniref:Fused adenylate cyclase/two component hybrid sensor/regulator n=1 Tax=Legionella shakespearei DSM 23087 TaxID=1122169 RepID=A0A0W0YVC9_9GAMM|nr:sensor domain-containing diguanylate cyclase [Legionella shakespearei]KTD60833.1 fused adenylate cyclase/two component hybrid sensor/regulator [Legionella shakespearei DSM 23087]